MITAPGFHPDVTAAEYFREICPAPALTASGIKTLLRGTPAEFAYAHPAITPESPEAASTAAKRFGNVAHELSLGKGKGYAVGDFATWGSNDAKAFKAGAEMRGLVPVKVAEFEAAQECAVVMKAEIAGVLSALGLKNKPYLTETVIAWQEETRHGPIWCRAMLDVWADSIATIVDPKFSKQIGDGVFEAHACAMSWDFQSCWYMRGVEAIRPDLAGRLRFVTLPISPAPPHVSRWREADEATRYMCEPYIAKAIETFAACLYAGGPVGQWPGYPRKIEKWSAPPWVERRRIEAMEESE